MSGEIDEMGQSHSRGVRDGADPVRDRGAALCDRVRQGAPLCDPSRVFDLDVVLGPERPDGYWPCGDAPPDDRAWERAVDAFRKDLAAMCALVADPATDLFAPIPHGDGQTVLREALLVADHNAYHLGQLVVVRRLLGCWPEEG